MQVCVKLFSEATNFNCQNIALAAILSFYFERFA